MRVIYAGTPEFAAVALEAIYQAGHEVVLVLTQPDRPAGRGMQLQASPVKQCALAHGTPVSQPVSLKLDGKYPDDAQQAHALMRDAQADVMVVAAYGLILPRSVLDIPQHGCLNIHASLLPRWRGAAPIHRAIESGDAETGVTIMQMEEGLDTGPMLMEERLPIADTDTTGTLHDKLAGMGAGLVVRALAQLVTPGLQAVVQPEAGVTYAAKISKEEAHLGWDAPAVEIARKIRAFNPFPGVTMTLAGETIKVWEARVVDGKAGHAPGDIVVATPQDGLVVACGEQALSLQVVQKPGGKRLPVSEFLKGFSGGK